MKSDPLADRVHDAVGAFTVPRLSAAAIAARIAARNASPEHRRRPVVAAVGGVALLAAALAVSVPTVEKWMTPAYFATIKRLTGVDMSGGRSYEVKGQSLDEALRHTRFPVVVPRGKRVMEAVTFPNDDGIMLFVAVDYHVQRTLDETWADQNPTKLAKRLSKLEGIGVRSDGSIRKFEVRHWRIGRVKFSMAMFSPAERHYAEEVERATRETAAGLR